MEQAQPQMQVESLVKEIPLLEEMLKATPAPRLPNPDEIAREFALVPSSGVLHGQVVEDEDDPELTAIADKHVAMLLAVKPEDFQAREQRRAALEQMGRSLQKEAVEHSSKMLQQPVKKLAELSGGGSSVSKDLIAFTAKIRENDPNDWDFGPGFIGRIFHKMPIVGEKVEEYFMQFQTAQSVIDQICTSLRNGIGVLERNNMILADDQSYMRTLTYKFQRMIKMGTMIDVQLEKAAQKYPENNDMHKFIQEELQFGLKKQLIDLGQQLTVNMQGVIAVEILRRNNKELIRGVNRGLNVTMAAIRYAALVAIALADQGIITRNLQDANEVASNMIKRTGEKLHQTSVEIHKIASSAMLDMTKLGEAWAHVNATWDELSTYRREALPQMSQLIATLHDMNETGEKTVQKMEAGNALRGQVEINLE